MHIKNNDRPPKFCCITVANIEQDIKKILKVLRTEKSPGIDKVGINSQKYKGSFGK